MVSFLLNSGLNVSDFGEPSFQNNWHGQCLGMMGSLTSNWKQLNSALREDSDVPDLWVSWQDKTK
ncbi:hypothetical protein BJX96DRAFT_147771 [Aspergillus floccosus]